jgi:hypothetical protein
VDVENGNQLVIERKLTSWPVAYAWTVPSSLFESGVLVGQAEVG